ncbi:MAG: hypothetical protein KF718_01045 [Polyangiaceae bacterium]|nr:hypothetical protein [Polyangiaceae bacterium]
MPRWWMLAPVCAACASTPSTPAPAPAPAPAASCPSAGASVAGPAYVPHPAASISVDLPPVPRLAERPARAGEDFTVWGASSALRSRFEQASVSGARIWITGYIVRTNLADAPRCAVHPSGVATPPRCTAPVPAFWIADRPDAAIDDSVKVMGWASNFAQIHDAIRAYAHPGAAAHFDDLWGVVLPNPLPAKGAKVRVFGSYATTFRRAAAGFEHDPVMGILSYEQLDVLERAPAPATLPGMKP